MGRKISSGPPLARRIRKKVKERFSALTGAGHEKTAAAKTGKRGFHNRAGKSCCHDCVKGIASLFQYLDGRSAHKRMS